MSDEAASDTAHEDEAEAEVDAPVVFLCKECNVVVGDTFAWVAAMESLGAITLRCASSSVLIGDVFATSKRRAARGSTYVTVKCQCSATLGRVYRTTTPELDPIRGMITFDISAINSYQLGGGSTMAKESEEMMEALLDLPTASSLQSDVLKLKNMILVLNDRIGDLEDSKAQSGGKRKKRAA